MKRLAMVLIVLFTATALFAGGAECKAKAAKSVELTGTIAQDGEHNVFRTADHAYTVCEKTKASVLKLGTDGAKLQVKGKVVSCGDGEELVIESAKKI